jgi:hypothetical protein
MQHEEHKCSCSNTPPGSNTISRKKRSAGCAALTLSLTGGAAPQVLPHGLGRDAAEAAAPAAAHGGAQR